MPVLVSDPLPVELEALLDRRRATGADHHDEMWQGILHMAPAPHERHAYVQVQLFALLLPPAREAGLRAVDSFNLGEPDDYRVPDGGLRRPGPFDLYVPTASLAIEVVSQGDETWDKLPFYAAHHVDELLIVDPQAQTVQWLALTEAGTYEPVERSSQIALGPADLAAQIDWPQAEK